MGKGDFQRRRKLDRSDRETGAGGGGWEEPEFIKCIHEIVMEQFNNIII